MKVVHVETGNIYTLVDIIKTKGVAVVIYEDTKGTRYARDFSKWFEKFVYVSEANPMFQSGDNGGTGPHIQLLKGKDSQYVDNDGATWVKQYGVPAKASEDFTPHSAEKPLFRSEGGPFLDVNKINPKTKGGK